MRNAQTSDKAFFICMQIDALFKINGLDNYGFNNK